MCSCEDADPNPVWREQVRRARKQHKCCECVVPILPGQRYRHGSGISANGDAFSLKWCCSCDDKMRAFQKAEGDGSCWPITGELQRTIRECADGDPDFARRYLAARRELRKARVAA